MTTSDPGSTSRLLRQVRDGDAGAFALLMGRYGKRLLLRIRLMMGPGARAHAESTDFLQDLFVDLARDLDRYEIVSEAEFLKLAVGMARNNIRESLRKRREKQLQDFSVSTIARFDRATSQAVPLDRLVTEEAIERLVLALEEMASDEREVIELRDFEQLPYGEIAPRMGRSSENAVQLLHARALTKLSARLQAPAGD